ncbi:type II toxin-antitoxin system RelE/ParE family toxin [Mucilaginibacter arboris]|uniref:Type II toxin-antitoxin system RelE/ParE family toxin n=1 Tax=Mucilaginibacter arboris TaxID=2682090 RepID=A0A7K1SWE6_9SPHI|nr:type II toxin-antitoxin system RelE/ParE family toxin [Mucilaginibacter arboris]MVN21624.1 hypothetical protein [Mucilaginibacter arboris]
MTELMIVFSEESIVTFQAIQAQIVFRFGQNEAEKFERRVLKTLNQISKFPAGFELVDQSSEVRKGFIHKNCSVFYQVKNSQIEILFFWDNRQKPML